MTESDPIQIEAILKEVDWLRALAVQLVRDVDRAEDLFQDTMVASMRDQASPRGALRPWLAQIARRLAWRSSRTDQRKARREGIAASSKTEPSAADTAERLEWHHGVITAVRDLEEPYRTAVLLRFFEDLPPREIAIRTSTPVETVKTRLKRGLAALRARLDTQYGNRKTWVGALLPTLGMRTQSPALVISSIMIFAMAAMGLVMAFPWNPAEEGRSAAAPESRPDEATTRIIKRDEAAAEKPERIQVASERLLVLVTDASSDLPQADVTVYVIDMVQRPKSANDRLQAIAEQYRQGKISLETYFGGIAVRYQTNAEGIVSIPQPKGQQATVRALTPTMQGHVQYVEMYGTELLVLKLQRRVRIDVKVVNDAGLGQASVPVAFVQQERQYAERVTDNDGRAQLDLSLVNDRGGQQQGHVGISAPFIHSTRLPVDLRNPPDQPLRLLLPEFGALEIAAVSRRGQELDEPGTVSLYARTSATDRHDSHSHGHSTEASSRRRDGRILASTEFVDGVARFSRIGLNSEFTIRVRIAGETERTRTRVAGPTIAGQTKRVAVPLNSNSRIASFRVLDPDGSLLTHQQFWYRVLDSRQDSLGSRGVAATDRQGILRVTLSSRFEPGMVRHLELVRQTLRALDHSSIETSALVDLSQAFRSKVTRLTDVQLDIAPIILKGIVTNALGRPLREAGLEVSYTSRTSSGQKRRDGFQVIITDDQGRFTCRGYAAASDVRVSLTRRGYITRSSIVLPSGSKAAKLLLFPAGSLHCSLQRGFPAEQVRATLTALDGNSQRPATAYSRAFDAEARPLLVFDRLTPGRYRFDIRLQGCKESAFEIPVEVLAGEEARPAALQDIDLSRTIDCVHITVHDPEHRAIPSAQVWSEVNNSGTLLSGANPAGVAIVAVQRSGTDLRVDAEGFRSATLRDVTSDQTIVLQRKPH